MKRPKRNDLKPSMTKVRGIPATWDVSPIVSVVDLAGWLGVSEKRLLWLAAVDDHSSCGGNHYVCKWIRKRLGFRLIESPKLELKRVQRQILHELLNAIPPSKWCHGFVRNRSVQTYVEEHCGKAVCLKMDLKNFFPSIRAGRIFGVLKRVGYPMAVCRVLTGLCTTSTASDSLARLRELSGYGQGLHHLYGQRHLPQGAPTSPTLANMCAYRLDCRLAGLAERLGGQFSRYADDLLFSFDQAAFDKRQARNWIRRLVTRIGSIAMEEGFEVNFRKTRAMFRAQKQLAAGVVLNQFPNLARSEFDRIKAILHNCVVHGPESQNKDNHNDFRSHLAGKIAWIRQLNSQRADKLDGMFAKINW